MTRMEATGREILMTGNEAKEMRDCMQRIGRLSNHMHEINTMHVNGQCDLTRQRLYR